MGVIGRAYVGELKRTYVYEINQNVEYFEDFGMISLYGLQVYEEGCENMTDQSRNFSIKSLSSDYQWMQELTNKLIQAKALPSQMLDILTDYVAY